MITANLILLASLAFTPIQAKENIEVSESLKYGTIDFITEEENEKVYCIATIKPYDYFIYKEDSFSNGYENYLIEKVENNKFKFEVKEGQKYKLSCLFKLDVKSIVDENTENSKVGKLWENEIAPLLGGISIGTAVSFLLNFIFTFVQRSNLKLGNRNFREIAQNIASKTEEYKSISNGVMQKADDLIDKAEESLELAKQSQEEVKEIKREFDILLSSFVDYVNHDKNSVQNGVARRINDKVNDNEEN